MNKKTEHDALTIPKDFDKNIVRVQRLKIIGDRTVRVMTFVGDMSECFQSPESKIRRRRKRSA